MTLSRSDLASFNLRRNSASSDDMPSAPTRGSGLRRSRSSGLASMMKNEATRVNATWDAPSRINRRSLNKMLSCAHDSPAKCTKACLIPADELKMITNKLATTSFIGVVDPRFHSEYLQGPEDIPKAA